MFGILRSISAVAVLATAGIVAPGAPSLGAAGDRAVIVLVVDGLEPETVTPELTPNITALSDAGQLHRWMDGRGVMVSETNPNHTSMLTGAYPDRTGLLMNAFYNARSGASGAKEAMERPSLIMVPTLFDAIEAQQPALRTASIMGKEKLRRLFDCTRTSAGACGPSSDNPERIAVEHVAPDFVGGASTAFDPDEHEHDALAEPASGTGYAADNEVMDIVIAQHTAPQRPDFTFVNLGVVDGFQHLFGAHSAEGLAAVANADANIGRLVGALRAAGRWASTVLFITADHSFQDTGDPVGAGGVAVGNPVTPHASGSLVVLPELLGSCSNGTPSVAVANGGIATVALRGYDPYAGAPIGAAQAACLRQLRARALANAHVAEALYRADAGEGASTVLSSVHPDWRLSSPRLGEMILVAEPGAAFTEARASGTSVLTGAHGGPTTTAVPFLIASGAPSIVAGTDTVNTARHVDIAPTVAWLLGIDPPPASEGRVLCEAFGACGP